MKVLIVGLGSVGSKHIGALLKIDDKTEIFALRSSKNSKKDFRVIDLYDWGQLKKLKFNFAIISTPSFFHLDNILKIAHLEIPLMIEKPLFINKTQINKNSIAQFRWNASPAIEKR